MSSLLLFEHETIQGTEQIGTSAVILRQFAQESVANLLADLRTLLKQAPLQTMVTPMGHAMSVKTTNCGHWGWMSDQYGYRYTRLQSTTRQPWPDMPKSFALLAHKAASEAGFPDFVPDACLINRYTPGSRMGLHQDKNEKDLRAPIVSVSLGLAAIFLWGGHTRSDPVMRYPLFHTDVVVWGGEDRLRFHGVLPVREGRHVVMGPQRINLTLRKAS